jgi:hypothetical protein
VIDVTDKYKDIIGLIMFINDKEMNEDGTMFVAKDGTLKSVGFLLYDSYDPTNEIPIDAITAGYDLAIVGFKNNGQVWAYQTEKMLDMIIEKGANQSITVYDSSLFQRMGASLKELNMAVVEIHRQHLNKDDEAKKKKDALNSN